MVALRARSQNLIVTLHDYLVEHVQRDADRGRLAVFAAAAKAWLTVKDNELLIALP